MARGRKRDSRRSRLNWIVWVLVLAVSAGCALISWQEKTGESLPVFDNLAPGGLRDFLDELSEGESAPVAGGEVAVHYLDMGQAESTLIVGPRASVLIDGGENNQGEQVLRYLKGQGVTRLDYVIGTHPHADHIGGLDTVIQGMGVDQVILPQLPDEIAPATQTYLDLLTAIRDKGLAVTPAVPGESVSLGEGASLEILGPAAQYTDLNNMSVVCRLTYGETAFLFTGDACLEAEEDMLAAERPLGAGVLSLGHHGSSTSTGARWLQRVGPKIAVISAGEDNSYGHPHREVVQRLEERGVTILRTDRNGGVVIRSDGKTLAVATER